MWVLIDDQRELGCDIIARNYAAGKAVLEAMHDKIACLCIDHDLGGLSTGYDLISWALEANKLPSQVQIVSSNPVGRENIERALLSGGYRKNFTMGVWIKE